MIFAERTQWVPAHVAAAALGIAERTLRHRAAHGQIERRREGATVLYRVDADTLPPVAADTGTAVAGEIGRAHV